ncbi:hypothetical protein CapIbe_017923 [Capra ibex]
MRTRLTRRPQGAASAAFCCLSRGLRGHLRVGRRIPVCTAWVPVGLGYDLVHLRMAPASPRPPSAKSPGSSPTRDVRGGSKSDRNPSS